MEKVKRFNVRVYALIFNKSGALLLTDEIGFGRKMTKFPGGGLEWGEGTLDCIKRECMEEIGQEAEVLGHFYTTDFFQESSFSKKDQILSIYYRVELANPDALHVVESAFDFPEEKEDAQVFRWVSLNELREEDLTFPIDRKVLNLLKEN